MKIVHEKQTQKLTKKQREAETSKMNRSYIEKVRAKWFCCEFNLSFLQLICKAILLFESNLEVALSIILEKGN